MEINKRYIKIVKKIFNPKLCLFRPVTAVQTTATTQRNTDVNASAVALLSFLLLLNMMQVIITLKMLKKC